MRTDLKLFMVVVLASFLVSNCEAAPLQAKAQPGGSSNPIESRFAQIHGAKIHYLKAGHGPTVILIHGYTQTSRMWRPLIPRLTAKFTVIAPDLPGIGDSDIPKD